MTQIKARRGARSAAQLDLSAEDVRRIAVNAQGFDRPRPARPNLGHLRRVLARLGAFQIDAVNVLVRAHYLAAFSRLGPYPVDLLDRLTFREGAAFEYWGHAASVIDMGLYPSLRWRMARQETHPQWSKFLARVEAERPGFAEQVYAEVAERGPLSFTQLLDPARRPKDPRYAAATVLWDRGSDGKTMLEYLYSAGKLAVAGRNGFSPAYDLAERVIPAETLAAPEPKADEGQRDLVRLATAALGVATVKDVRDYFRMPLADTKARLCELVSAGELSECRPEGWTSVGYLHPSANAKPVHAAAVLSPFDSLLWERARVRQIFGFRHSFEIYVPEAKREYGYFVLPFLLGDRLQARVDLKADRAGRRLLVKGSFAEPNTDHDELAGALTRELRSLADWLDLDEISIASRGNLAAALRGWRQ
ncbi:MAG: winged helix-turn-helix domain-containing protein [Geodermatophilaceae bacterium]|nr:winged helix-turn-helix domain-containing protein [Geodermatophilaceae bacterium]